jgi:hypothetical protein
MCVIRLSEIQAKLDDDTLPPSLRPAICLVICIETAFMGVLVYHSGQQQARRCRSKPGHKKTMVHVKKLMLDVLKPHEPNGLTFACAIAERGPDYHVTFTVKEVDEKTENVIIVIRGEDIRFDAIVDTIAELGGSLHSIDEVEVVSGV